MKTEIREEREDGGKSEAPFLAGEQGVYKTLSSVARGR